MLNQPPSAMSSKSNKSEMSEMVLQKELAPIPVVPPVPVKPINEPTGLHKLEMPKFNFNALVFPRRTEESMYNRPVNQYVCSH